MKTCSKSHIPKKHEVVVVRDYGCLDLLLFCICHLYIYIMFVCGLCQHFFHSYVFINNHLITHALTNFLLKTKKWSIRFLFVTRATESVKTKSVYYCTNILYYLFFFQAEDGIRDCLLSRGLGDVYKRQVLCHKILDLRSSSSNILMFFTVSLASIESSLDRFAFRDELSNENKNSIFK